MNPEKDVKALVTCPTCEATAPDDSKHRGRFKRRHERDNVCGNYARKQEEGKAQLAADLLAARVKEGAKEGGTRVDMSGDSSLVGEVDGGVLQGGAQ